jgi:uncharacterized membrane protein YebE (DUF533 family)
MTRIAILTATVLLATTSIASARDYGYGGGYGGGSREIDARQANQEHRIQQGVRSGELTRGEYQKLEAEQARIRDMERRAKADGHVSRSERDQIRHAQNDAGRHIYQEKHDSERSQARRWWRWY